MRRTSITRQFLILVIAFAIAMPASLGGLAYVFYASRANSRRSAAIHDRGTTALFVLVDSVSQVQGTVQSLLREKDPDAMEKLIDQHNSGSKTVLAKIREAGDAGAEISSAFETLANASSSG